jgi:hypothetical protein
MCELRTVRRSAGTMTVTYKIERSKLKKAQASFPSPFSFKRKIYEAFE